MKPKKATYAPIITNEPWATLATLKTPKMRLSPSVMRP